MLLARRRPVAGFRKRLPVAAAGAPKARGFGPRQKVVATPRTGLRIASSAIAGEPILASSSLGEGAAADWIGNIDWVGDPGSSVAASRANGHATEAFTDPPPEAIPVPSREIYALN